MKVELGVRRLVVFVVSVLNLIKSSHDNGLYVVAGVRHC